MTTNFVSNRLTAADVSAEWRRSDDKSMRDMGDLLLIATQVEGFPWNYTDRAVHVAEEAIRCIGNGRTQQCIEELLELDRLRSNDARV